MKGQFLVLLAATVAIFLATGVATPKHLSAAPASTTQHRSPTVTGTALAPAGIRTATRRSAPTITRAATKSRTATITGAASPTVGVGKATRAGQITTTPVTGTATRTSAVRTPTLTATPCSCSGDLYNCKDFGSADDAQTCYEYCKARVGYDVHKLDRDNDGIACESR
ncbi:MAG: excalibur calcium-binding domain-containing protein [Anaerolineae bacterium]